MPSSSVLLGIALPLIYLVASVGLCAALFRERRNPTSYTRRTDDLAWWAELPTETQEEMDNAALDEAEQAEADARWDAAESAEFLADRARFNALYHP